MFPLSPSENCDEINSFLFPCLFVQFPQRYYSKRFFFVFYLLFLCARKTPLPRADVDFRTFTAVITDKRHYNYPDVDLAMTQTRSIIAIIVSWLTYFRHVPSR